MRAVLLVTLSLLGLAAILLVGANAWVVSSSSPFVYENMARMPGNDIGLVLGTSPYTRYGHKNLLFKHRIAAAAELYNAGKVKHLLLSGANPDKTYNEPRKMYQALRKAGVPDSAMTLDFAGFRTLDSVVRAKRVFGLKRFTIISQRFHDYRAVFIARHKGIDAVAYSRPQADARQPLRTEAREYIARGKAVLDLFVFLEAPRHLGKRKTIKIEQPEPDSASH